MRRWIGGVGVGTLNENEWLGLGLASQKTRRWVPIQEASPLMVIHSGRNLLGQTRCLSGLRQFLMTLNESWFLNSHPVNVKMRRILNSWWTVNSQWEASITTSDCYPIAIDVVFHIRNLFALNSMHLLCVSLFDFISFSRQTKKKNHRYCTVLLSIIETFLSIL